MPHGQHDVSTTGFWIERCPLDYSLNPPRRAFRPTQSFLSRSVVSGSLVDKYMPVGTRLRDGNGVRWMAIDVPKYGRVIAELREMTDEEFERIPEQLRDNEPAYVFVEPLHAYRPKKSGMALQEIVIEDY